MPFTMAGSVILKLELSITIFCLVMRFLLAFSGGDEVTLSVWEDKLPGLTMPIKLARLMSPLNNEETSVLANEAAAKGLQAVVDSDNSFCKRAGLLCEKTQISKMPDCDEKPYKKRKLLDIVQDGLVAGCGKAIVPDDAEGNQLHSDFFRVKEITTDGQKLFFPDFPDSPISDNISFLPHKVAQTVHFHSQELMSLVQALHIAPTGSEFFMKEMASTLSICEAPPSSIETKRCVISVESMAEFVSDVMGGSSSSSSSNAVEMVEGSASSTTKLSNRVVTVKSAKQVSPASLKHVACHSMIFPFRVYYCHYVKSTEMYMVQVEDEKSGVVQSVVAECHMDTKPYPAQSLALLDLKLEPGEGEFCHWVPSDTLLFVTKA